MGFLTYNILICTTAVPKGISNEFCTPIIFKNPVKTSFSMRNKLFTICVDLFYFDNVKFSLFFHFDHE